ncbi:MAG: 3-deoxy-manno-octulosonate cytidylyltransferase [Hydrogenovibrio crunogenus]|uniref:3-deoxy-manno-octulosonate cytidylyltransferase 1 n=1 Tax=Hydrogenovibrio crunogenus (strain DSM 25203 / XCL-2) TaxID=317025 RepID=KDSB1_HYDCU|nr:RecName: Full=3-deoxy-manno-octulosonate cytidylyltransferase 1; AltName: Full=CMP-2-keto-3-deoxyoctulosonic acid synthase 1; Short=CKS 1; Short=CMP-KDO synthase 1 [Hydrogenovibrio crunogenus XCL-2]MBD3612844.1 3-deoxy-manno-octulosonate cytidylyltransferase [Hydrogenovibrio crunogenus]
MSFIVIIPARYESSRLLGKPLMDIQGKPMVEWTWMQAKKSGATRVVIATESDRVKAVCESFGAEVCLTSERHESGTERIAEVASLLGLNDDDILVNVQGDEPLLPPDLIHQVAEGLETHPNTLMATLCEPILDVETVFDPHAVKVIRDCNNYALNFTRAPMPWSRDTFGSEPKTLPGNWPYRRHIGLYAYRSGFVKRYVEWPVCALEQVEKLEQLRVLWHGEKILVLDALCEAGVGVDTEQDLIKVRKIMANLNPDGAL